MLPHVTYSRYCFLPDNTDIPLSHLVYFSNPDVYPLSFFVRISGGKDQGTRTDSSASHGDRNVEVTREYYRNLEAVQDTTLTY